MPSRLKANIPLLPVSAKLTNIPCDIGHVGKIMMSFQPLMYNIRPVLAAKGESLSLFKQISVEALSQ